MLFAWPRRSSDADTSARQPLSMRLWLALLALLLSVPMFVIEGMAMREEQARLLAQGRQDSEQRAEALVAAQQQQLDGVGQLLAAVAASPALDGAIQPRCGRYLQRLQQQQPGYVNLGLLDAQGRIVCVAAGGQEARHGLEPYFRRARDERVLSVGGFAISPLSGKPVLRVGRPVQDDDGQLLAVAVASVELAWLAEPLHRHRLPAGAQAYVTDASGRVLASGTAGVVQAGAPLPDARLRAALAQRYAGPWIEDDGRQWRLLQPIAVAGQPALYLALSVPQEAWMAGAWRAGLRRLAVLAALALALAGLFWLIGDRWLVQPAWRVLRSLRQARHAESGPARAVSGRPLREFQSMQQGVQRLAQLLDETRRDSEKTRQALRESEAAQRALFETLPLPLWVMDIASRRFLAVNGAAALHYGYPAQAFLEMTLDDIQPPAWQSVEEHLPAIRPHRRHDGTVCQMQISCQPMVYEGHMARLCMALDVTQIHAAQERVREVNANLERLVAERARELVQSNRELEAFASSVSHDLRNPLHAIAMFGELLRDHAGEALDAQAQLYLSRMQEGTQRMEVLIDDLLSLARVAQAELVLAPVDLSALALEVVQELRTSEPERVLQVVLAPGLRCVGDARLLRQVLANLLGNAWKFTRHSSAPRIELGLLHEPGEPTCLHVSDNGAGFEPQHAERVFEPFQRLHDEREYPGSGVGLASVRRIVARHGGRVWARAAAGEGASFYLVLPGLTQQL